MRILIIGGLGYIGSAIIEECKAKLNDSIKIDIIDKKFIPYIIANLPNNFHFTQGNIRDDKVILPLLEKEPDIIYILAAEVEAEKSINKERAIWENNYEAVIKIIDKCPKESRIIFASTGNVFGGLNETDKFMELTEEDEPKPKYPYAESKRAVEQYLFGSEKNFIICRFGTNYGYSPSIRFNLVTNNFVKKALSGEPIIIYGQGKNYRPTVCVKDVASAAIFLGREVKASREIFHVVSENFRIIDLANKIRDIIPSVKFEFLAKEVPFNSYHLSSEKIKKFGFSFNWKIERAITEMIGMFKSIRSF